MNRPEQPPGFTAIYALCEPDGSPRYVGASVAPRRRFWMHLTNGRRAKPVGCGRWIKSLLEAGQRPTLQILEVVTDAEAVLKELAWIAALLLDGHSLLNSRPGRNEMLLWESEPGSRSIASLLETTPSPKTLNSSSPPG